MKHLKLVMVGGGQGAFIVAVHRIASRIDGTERIEDVTGDDILSMIILGKNPKRETA